MKDPTASGAFRHMGFREPRPQVRMQHQPRSREEAERARTASPSEVSDFVSAIRKLMV